MWEWDGRVKWVAVLIVAALLFGGGLQLGRWQAGKEKVPEVPVVIKGVGQQGISAPAEAGQGREPSLISEAVGMGGAQEKRILVHVAGAVSQPGVYELAAGARVGEAVKLAGPSPEANLDVLNLAAPLSDGQKVVVPKKGEEINLPSGGAFSQGSAGYVSGGTTGSAAPAGAKVNINTAGLAELDSLPGIGPALAQRIIDYRNTYGPFRSIEDLQNVSGIGAKRFEELKDKITVN
ncbi:MAG: competence protein ComEA [Clostridia bacterium]|nr:competence protein ComEA [Clostridia bacterium]